MKSFSWGIFGSNATTQFSRLWVLRAFFFGVLIYDLIGITFKHAARYGVDDFNIAHFGWLNALLPLPDPMLVGTLWTVCAFAAVFAALNVHTGAAIRTVAIIYGGVYFWSQIDSYQHHYLNAMIAFILAILPTRVWQSPNNETLLNPSSPFIGLLYVEVGLIYLWTGIAKVDATWLSGATMMSIGHGDELLVFTSHISELLYGTSGDPRLAMDALYRTLSVSVVAGEILVAFCYFCPRLRTLGLILAPIFHLSVEFLGLDIELFSLYMIGINLILLSPDRLWHKIHTLTLKARMTPLPDWCARHRHLILTLSTLLSAAMLYGVPFTTTQSVELSIALSLCACLVAAWTWLRHSARDSHVAASATLVFAGILLPQLLDSTEARYDYHRMLGGDLSRRLPAQTAPTYDVRLEEAISVYGVANAALTKVPARRTKQARLILNGRDPDKFARAGAVLNEAYMLHRRQLSEMERQFEKRPSKAMLERLIKVETSLGRICKSLGRIPSAHYAHAPREIELTLSEMSKNSQRHLDQLARLSRQELRNSLQAVFQGLSSDKRYRPTSDELVSIVSVPSGPQCDERLKRHGRWGLLRSQMRLGRKDRIQPSLIQRTSIDTSECSIELRYPVSGIISARVQRSGLSKLTRSRQRVFGR